MNAYLDWPGTLSGLRRMAPLSLFVVAFGLAFGVAAIQQGLGDLDILLMSALMFAGSAQFAALDLWGPSLPLAALLATTFAINARHLLMGAALYPWLKDMPATQRYASVILLSDSNWAMAASDYQQGRRNIGTLVGGGLALWLAWMLGTLLGVIFGSGIEQPERFGMDVIMGCFLTAMLLGGKGSLWALVPWTVAALATLLALWWLPDNTHVIVGALAGGMVGLIMPDTRARRPS